MAVRGAATQTAAQRTPCWAVVATAMAVRLGSLRGAGFGWCLAAGAVVFWAPVGVSSALWSACKHCAALGGAQSYAEAARVAGRRLLAARRALGCRNWPQRFERQILISASVSIR